MRKWCISNKYSGYCCKCRKHVKARSGLLYKKRSKQSMSLWHLYCRRCAQEKRHAEWVAELVAEHHEPDLDVLTYYPF